MFYCKTQTLNNPLAILVFMRAGVTILLIACLLLSACSSSEKTQDEKNDVSNYENLTGIRVSDWYKSEQYGKDIIDIFNFDDRERKINVTTVCFDKDDKQVPSDDSEVLTIPANHQWTWIPVCPEEAISYTILVFDAEKQALEN
jgi:hypothetical protein